VIQTKFVPASIGQAIEPRVTGAELQVELSDGSALFVNSTAAASVESPRLIWPEVG